MTVYLEEDNVGADADVVGFPFLLTCVGVVLLTRDKAYGVHLMQHADDPDAHTAAGFVTFVAQDGVKSTDLVTLYGSCNFAARYPNQGAKGWVHEMTHIAGLLGYRGTVRGFDTSIIDPKPGTYVEYRREAARNRCRIFYKRSSKMQPLNSGKVAGKETNAFTIDVRGDIVKPRFAVGSVAIIETFSNKGLLHEVNYAQRLRNFEVV